MEKRYGFWHMVVTGIICIAGPKVFLLMLGIESNPLVDISVGGLGLVVFYLLVLRHYRR